MSKFDELSDYDFELLVADLLSAKYKRRYETFARGADGGIDLRAELRNGTHVVQCKHYPHAPFAQLFRAARKERVLLEVMDTKPRRYSFVTSKSLTVANKAKLVEVMHPFVRTQTDVLGYEDLAALLRKHPSVERSHAKLWLSSAAVLSRVVHSEIHSRSQALVADIQDTLPRYVQTRSFGDAQALLEKHKVLVIAGPPGVGKTTLARLLLAALAQRGFVPYAVHESPGEIWKVISPSEPQVFFFDDFLGRTALYDTVKRDPRDLSQLIRQIHRDPTTRLILSTREYIFQQARSGEEELRWHDLETDRYLLRMDRYTRLEKAHVLYNHVYFSPEVDRSALTSLRRGRSYLKIIDHRSYTPRLVEWMTGLGGQRPEAKLAVDFATYCLSVLDHPEALWEHAYTNGLDSNARGFLTALASLPRQVPLAALELAFGGAASAVGLQGGRRDFDLAVKVLQESFIRVGMPPDATEPVVSVINPSLVDFLRAKITETKRAVEDAFAGAVYFQQTEWIYASARDAGHVESASVRSAFVDAVYRTFDAPQIHGIVWSDQSETEKVQTLLDWSIEDSRVAGPMKKHIKAAQIRLERAITIAFPMRLRGYPAVIAALRQIGQPTDSITRRLKARLRELDDDLNAYEMLADLRRTVRGSIDYEEWIDIQSAFMNWTETEPDLDDEEELDHLERVAAQLDCHLDDGWVDYAREEIQQAVAEANERALEEVDPADVEQDPDDDWRIEMSSEDDHIESMFGALEK